MVDPSQLFGGFADADNADVIDRWSKAHVFVDQFAQIVTDPLRRLDWALPQFIDKCLRS